MAKVLLKKPVFKMYQEVVLVSESVTGDVLCENKSLRIKKGQRGVVVLICKTPDVPYIGYVVEFFDKKGESIAVGTVKETDIAALPDGYPDAKAIKPRKSGKDKNKSKNKSDKLKSRAA